MEKSNPKLKKSLLEVVDNQLKANDPAETRKTFDRLVSKGYSEQQAKELIATVVSAHVYRAIKDLQPFDVEKYLNDLRILPKLPQN